MTNLPASRLRNLPSVDQVLKTPLAGAAIQRFGRLATTNAVRETLASRSWNVKHPRMSGDKPGRLQ